jgi:hypothetical protein
MIKTQSYNDFSSFSLEQKHDYSFMLEQIKIFKENGGDLSLPVKANNIDFNGEIKLIPFKEFIIQNIEQYSNFLDELKIQGIIKGNQNKTTICDFVWDSSTESITEKANYGLYWMRDNFSQNKDEIMQAFKNLLNDLPDDLSQVKIFNQIGVYGKTERKSVSHPLYIITKEINQPELYDLLFQSRPQIKNEFIENSIISKKPKFFYIINRHETNVLIDDAKNFDTAILFYKHDIAKDYFHEKENLSELHRLICRASYVGDIEFLNMVLPKVNLNEIEQKKDATELSLRWAKDAEIANILFKYNALVEKTVSTPNGIFTNNLILNEGLAKLDVLDLMFQKYPKYQEQIKSEPEAFYAFMQQRPIEFTKLLVEKYQFPLENFDMLSIAYKKTNSDNFDDYKWLVQHGADIRENTLFCAEMVNKREIGLKIIRGLNKEGIIVSKAPDFIFNIFQNSPTKNFLTYYDKLSSIELEKTTKEGLPAWWGAKNYSDYLFMFNRIKNYNQTTQDGKTLLFNLLEMQLDTRGINPKEIIKLQFKKLKSKEPEYKLDLSYTDKNGNNFMHYLLSFNSGYKNNIDLELIELLKDNSIQNPFEFLSKENVEGVSPIDLFLTQNNLSNYDFDKTLRLLIETAPEYINFNKVLQTGKTIGEHFIEGLAYDSAMKSLIEATILQYELSSPNENKTKKIKL